MENLPPEDLPQQRFLDDDDQGQGGQEYDEYDEQNDPNENLEEMGYIDED